jgi:sugar phosphate isomerase/epimerase
MEVFRLAVATRCWGTSIRTALAEASRSGAQGVQFDLRDELTSEQLSATGWRDLKHYLQELSLQVSGTVFPLRRPLADPFQLERRITALQQAMRFAAQLKAATLSVPVGRLPAQDTAEFKTFREILIDLAQLANHTGVMLAITPLQDDPAAMADLVRSITTGPVGIDVDPAQLAMAAQSTPDTLRGWYGLIAHVQLRDGVRDLRGSGEELPVGQGAVDWVELLAVLGEMEYRGWLTAVRTQGADLSGDVRRAVAYVQQLLLGGG